MRKKLVWFFCAGIVSTALGGTWDSGTVQPIPFNHYIHTVKNELSCDTCHQSVYDKPFAGLPRADVCMMCHSEDITTNPAAAPYIRKIRAYAQNGTAIPWVRLYVLPATVYYSHRRHAKIAKLDCSICHGDIGRSTSPPAYPIARTLDMDTCIACHVKSNAGYECVRCHR